MNQIQAGQNQVVPPPHAAPWQIAFENFNFHTDTTIEIPLPAALNLGQHGVQTLANRFRYTTPSNASYLRIKTNKTAP